MKPPTVEIHGTNTGNRGGELMAKAITQQILNEFPEGRLVVEPGFGNFASRGRYGFLTTPEFRGGIRTWLSSSLISICNERVRRGLGLIDASQVDLVLDASGFAFSDKWGPEQARSLVRKMSGRKRRNARLVLMPQAFGPFQDAEVARWTKKLADRAELIYARDAQSYRSMTELLGETPKLKCAPDFTTAVSCQERVDIVIPPNSVAIVPNVRMLDKGGYGEAYLSFVANAVEAASTAGLTPVFLLHDAFEDRRVIDSLGPRGRDIMVIGHNDPVVLKGLLGRFRIVIASRFHALVGSLTQEVPSIGVGWSHKYEELFASFKCPELLIKDMRDTQRLKELIIKLCDSDSAASYKSRLQSATEAMKSESGRMWEEIFCLVRSI